MATLNTYEVTVEQEAALRGRTTPTRYETTITVYNAASPAAARKAVSGKGKVVRIKKLNKR